MIRLHLSNHCYRSWRRYLCPSPDLAKFVIEIQTALRGPTGKVLNQQLATEMVTPVSVGKYGIGLTINPSGQSWQFSHSGSNWGYRAWMMGHVSQGYGIVIMANSDNGMALLNQVADRIVNAYHWDENQAK